MVAGMTARQCFTGKMAAGTVSDRAGRDLLALLEEFEREHNVQRGDAAGARRAAAETAEAAQTAAARKADDARDAIIRQANILRAAVDYDATVKRLRETPGSLGFGNQAPPSLGRDQSTVGAAMRSLLARDPFEISTWGNVFYTARTVREEAHRLFAESLEYLRPKNLGFTAQAQNELQVLRALYGDTAVVPEARPVAAAWQQVADNLADQFIAEGGHLAKRETWRLPNPSIDASKVRALGPERFKALVRDVAERRDILDFDTGKPMTDAKFEAVLDDVTNDILLGAEGLPSAAVKAGRALANSRDFPRFFAFKDAESWLKFAETVGEHASVFDTMMSHIASMADDIGQMKILGRNPEATKRFMQDLIEREAGRLRVEADAGDARAVKAAVKENRAHEARARRDRRLFENLYAEVTGANKIPANTTLAVTMSDARHWLTSIQLGSAMISSFNDSASLAMAARFNGLPVMNTVARAVQMLGEKGSEIFAAQQGVVLDSLAHGAGHVDKVMGETIRTGLAAKVSNANIRLSGLRRWTSVLRSAFALEMMAHVARNREVAFGRLERQFASTLDRYGIGADEWKLIQATAPHEPRPGAFFIRAADIAEGGTPAHRAAAEKLSRLINTEMDYAVIEGDPVTRALMLGQSLPGTIGGEARRSVAMYRSFPATFIMMHFARAAARGWNGGRMGHAALAFSAMTALGALSMQAKEIIAGRDPLSLDPTSSNGLRAWGKATLQGGGLGVFGDVLFVDQTKYGNSWAATVAGPVAGAVETVLGDFVFKNIQLAGKGQETHFFGDALYTAGRYLPGSSLWFGRLAFQRAVLDQLALMADPRSRERFARIEEQARKDWGQRYWLPPGRTEVRRAPDLSAALGAIDVR